MYSDSLITATKNIFKKIYNDNQTTSTKGVKKEKNIYN